MQLAKLASVMQHHSDINTVLSQPPLSIEHDIVCRASVAESIVCIDEAVPLALWLMVKAFSHAELAGYVREVAVSTAICSPTMEGPQRTCCHSPIGLICCSRERS